MGTVFSLCSIFDLGQLQELTSCGAWLVIHSKQTSALWSNQRQPGTVPGMVPGMVPGSLAGWMEESCYTKIVQLLYRCCAVGLRIPPPASAMAWAWGESGLIFTADMDGQHSKFQVKVRYLS